MSSSLDFHGYLDSPGVRVNPKLTVGGFREVADVVAALDPQKWYNSKAAIFNCCATRIFKTCNT